MMNYLRRLEEIEKDKKAKKLLLFYKGKEGGDAKEAKESSDLRLTNSRADHMGRLLCPRCQQLVEILVNPGQRPWVCMDCLERRGLVR